MRDRVARARPCSTPDSLPRPRFYPFAPRVLAPMTRFVLARLSPPGDYQRAHKGMT